MWGVKRTAQDPWWRGCGALLVLCLLLPLICCLCAHDECADAPCAASACVCVQHGHLAVTFDAVNLAPPGRFDRAVLPAAPERALLLTAAIFRPPIA